MSSITTIKLPCKITKAQTLYENLDAEILDSKRYKLLHSPGFVPGLAAGDIFELDPASDAGYRIVTRSRTVVVWFFYLKYAPELIELVKEQAASLGGSLDGGYKDKLLIFNFPISIGFDQIENFANAATGLYPDSEWSYGNIYDSKDGQTPLNWWREPA